jgi:arginyl-tRNA--protein-N-Asp/Glu arginylyltransferase
MNMRTERSRIYFHEPWQCWYVYLDEMLIDCAFHPYHQKHYEVYRELVKMGYNAKVKIIKAEEMI